jgi:hypothetical protein
MHATVMLARGKDSPAQGNGRVLLAGELNVPRSRGARTAGYFRLSSSLRIVASLGSRSITAS